MWAAICLDGRVMIHLEDMMCCYLSTLLTRVHDRAQQCAARFLQLWVVEAVSSRYIETCSEAELRRAVCSRW